MSKNEIISICSTCLDNPDETKIRYLIGSAIAFINGYTFQNYSIDEVENIPDDVVFCIFDLVQFKCNSKEWVSSERLSDYSITYSAEDITRKIKNVLNRYRIIHVE